MPLGRRPRSLPLEWEHVFQLSGSDRRVRISAVALLSRHVAASR
jgi:hypothetical protein